MRYILNERFALRGWELLPYAVADRRTGRASFISAQEMEALKLCSGRIETDLPLIPRELRDMLPAGELSDEELDAVSGGGWRRIETEADVDYILNSPEPYTVWVEGKYHGFIDYEFGCWNKFRIGELSGNRRADALWKVLGPCWADECTPEIRDRLLGRT